MKTNMFARGFLLILAMVLLLGNVLVVDAAESVTFTAAADKTSLKQGDTVTVSVNVSSSEPATTYGLMLSYDEAVFELVEGSCAASGALLNSFNNGFAFMFQDAIAYSGSVGTVTLKIKNDAPVGDATISGKVSVKNGSADVSAATSPTTITVVCASHTPGAVATCTEAQVCTVCQAELEAAKGHTEVVDKAIPATDTTAGKTEGKHCSVCNMVLVAQTDILANGDNDVIAEKTDGSEIDTDIKDTTPTTTEAVKPTDDYDDVPEIRDNTVVILAIVTGVALACVAVFILIKKRKTK